MKNGQAILFSILLLLVFGLGYYAYFLNTKSNNIQKNSYDYYFSELVNYSNNIENYLAKSMISKSTIHNAETLTKIWADSNMAVVYIESIPFDDKGTSQSIKFLNQVSDYAYSLSRKSINGEELTDDDFKNLKTLYKYSISFKDTLNEIALELNNGTLSWDDLDNTSKLAFADNEDINVFSNIESNFDDYEGLIYDGAYSDYIINKEKLGLVGDNISEDDAKNKIIEIFGKDMVEKIDSNGDIINGDIETYSFSVKLKNDINKMDIEVTKKGGWISQIIRDRDVSEVKIYDNDAIEKGKTFLDKLGYKNMKETYSLRQSNIVTINYAFEENDILMYPDLIKVKVALDNGDILGVEAFGYLNVHTKRNDLVPGITSEKAKEKLNKDLQIENERLAVIPLNNDKEVFCYEFKGKLEDREFLVYINAKTGEEEEILILLETEGGTLTI